jgi:hypothetical protein
MDICLDKGIWYSDEEIDIVSYIYFVKPIQMFFGMNSNLSETLLPEILCWNVADSKYKNPERFTFSVVYEVRVFTGIFRNHEKLDFSIFCFATSSSTCISK